mmetsp:Transcript_3952/g.3365  ORF Transcript_3952/g.3365 Transcript_3952/m.3365 type:complete len:124 (-) Transcript_3952:105-476(-)
MGKVGGKKRVGGAKKADAGGESTAFTSEIGSTVSDGASIGDVGAIRKLIQSLTQNTNPLKRSIDFVNDDIESMNKEMEFWRNQNLDQKAKYQIELKNTEESLQPLQNKLAEIEEQVKEKKLKI